MKGANPLEIIKKLQNHSVPDIAKNFSLSLSRYDYFSIHDRSMLYDFSKQNINTEIWNDLLLLAESCEVEERRDQMWRGEAINFTEDRAALHIALRHPEQTGFQVDGHDVMSEVHLVLEQMRSFEEDITSGTVRGSTGRMFDTIVNIGIGGSDLGPAMVCQALSPYRKSNMNAYFISNVDGAHISDILQEVDPETTLFIVASKTFTTDETLTNAMTARSWLINKLGEDAIGAHFVAVSTNLKATSEFGIAEQNVFAFWDWVGGRFSVWSSIGLSIVLYIGFENFKKFLAGAHEGDIHFKNRNLNENIPITMALLSFWHRSVCGYATQAVIPYDQRLSRLPAYLQQLEMESNGKNVSMHGEAVATATSPVIWGEPGTNGQHAFFQMLHQGTDMIPVDFHLAANAHEEGYDEHHQKLIANCLAQSEALMRGKSLAEVEDEMRKEGYSEKEISKIAPHRVFTGNRPSSTFIYARLDPNTLGKIMSFYEHKTFVLGLLWQINSFDQSGVELGKVLAKDLLPMIKDKRKIKDKDPSTTGLLNHIHNLRDHNA